MEHTLKERVNMMLERMNIHYGPNRIRRMSKEEINKMSILYGVTRKERKESHQIIEEVVKKEKTK
tara:strand:- start:851 stop:1045 length:195 start_codon:yes stop_codon:yes gene_type:complete